MVERSGWREWLRQKAIDWGFGGIIGFSLMLTLIGIFVALSPAGLVAGAVMMSLGVATAVSTAIFLACRKRQQSIKRAANRVTIADLLQGSDSTADTSQYIGSEVNPMTFYKSRQHSIINRLTLFFRSISKPTYKEELLQPAEEDPAKVKAQSR